MNCFAQGSRLKSEILFTEQKGKKIQQIILQRNPAMFSSAGLHTKCTGRRKSGRLGKSGKDRENLTKMLNILQSKEG